MDQAAEKTDQPPGHKRSKGLKTLIFGLKEKMAAIIAPNHGATAVEYALLAALAAAGVAGGMLAIAELVQLLFSLLNDATANAQNTVSS